jgi:hypothetical protein
MLERLGSSTTTQSDFQGFSNSDISSFITSLQDQGWSTSPTTLTRAGCQLTDGLGWPSQSVVRFKVTNDLTGPHMVPVSCFLKKNTTLYS